MLREAEIGLAQGLKTGDVCRNLGIAKLTFYRWRKEYGGLRTDHAKPLKQLEKENSRLKKNVADQAIHLANVKEV